MMLTQIEQRVGSKNRLVQLNESIRWYRFRKLLKGLHKNSEKSKGGPKAYDELKMFKAIILGQWHSLSEEALEEALRVRLDFAVFTGFELAEDVPDETTLNRFRNKLTEKGVLEKLLQELNKELERGGVKVKNAVGAIIDASIVESAARPQKEIEAMAVDREEKVYETSDELQMSKDPDAKWLKKGKYCYYGYKAFCRIDSADGFIEAINVLPANASEVTNLNPLLEGLLSWIRVYGDKGYASEENRETLRGMKLKNGIMYKAQRNKPLSHWQRIFNRGVSKIRYKVEQVFGILKRQFKFGRASYITLAKVKGQFYLKCICYNLLKASRKGLALGVN